MPASVETIRPVVGDELPGARGLTRADQVKIDDAMAGLCGARVYTPAECRIHSAASAERLSSQ